MSTIATLEDVLQPNRISSAWEKVRSNRGAAGEDNMTIDELSREFPSVWAAVERSVRSGTYRPAPLRPVNIPKPCGGTRRLAIPSVIDRVLQQSVASVMNERWETRFPAGSYAYRSGTGARAAVDEILAHAGKVSHPWTLHLDIRAFFDSIPAASVERVFLETPFEKETAGIACRSLSAPLAGPAGPRSREAGIPQGSPLSPVVSNAILLPFDLSFQNGGTKLFRYADDMLFICRDGAEAAMALERARAGLSSLGLEINEAKTRISALHESRFLGFGLMEGSGGWVRSIPPETWAACAAHLSRMEDSAKSPSEMGLFLNQWCGYFLPTEEDRARHATGLVELAGRFRLAAPLVSKARTTAPPGFSYSGQKTDAGNSRRDGSPFHRSRWALWYLFKRTRVGLTFRRKGFVPVPSGIRVCICGHNLYFRL